MFIAGREDAKQGTVGTIVSPVQAPGVVIDAAIPDSVVFSFSHGGELRQILVKINSSGGGVSTCTVTLLAPSACGEWKALSGDVTLGSAASPLLRNPHGLAQWGDMLYFIDYESRQIVLLGADELAGVSGEYTPVNTPFNLSGQLPPEAKGQAIIALGGRVYALYLNTTATATEHLPSTLIRLAIASNGALSFDTETSVGKNAQAIIPVNDGTATQLLIPAIGGPQGSGVTNETESNICCVPAIGTWPAYDPATVTAQIVVTGDPMPETGPTVYDIHALAAAMRNGTSMLYILTLIYNGSTAVWRLYQSTVGNFLSLIQPTPPVVPASLSDAVSQGKLEVIDEGTVATSAGLYFWDLLYEQTPGENDTGDRLWAALGTPILVTRAAAESYGSPTAIISNPYAFYGYNGGVNLNSLDLTIEAVNQARRGVSLKRGLRGTRNPKASESEEPEK
jgi:hypothetical protein